MSLLRRLVLAITVMIIALLAANVVVGVYNARSYFSHQLQALAEDTATSLGLTISHAAKDKDLAQVELMINVIFDRGYYQSITYSNMQGKVVVSRSREIRIEGVPQWFIDWIVIPQRAGTAEVVSGWFRLGELRVQTHPGYAYRDLWRVFTEQLWLFFFTAVLCYGLAGLGLKYLLRPLKRLEDQADAICRKEFPVQETLPNTPELRRMVVAMNRMVNKIKDMFQQQVNLTDELRREASIDALTGLPNRDEFNAQLKAWLESDHGGGMAALVIVHVAELQSLNDTHGREKSDGWLQQIAKVIEHCSSAWPSSILARRTGCDFCWFVPSVAERELNALATDLVTRIKLLEFAEAGKFNVGIAVSAQVDSLPALLGTADAALRQSTSLGDGEWVVMPLGNKTIQRAAGDWRPFLQNVINNQLLSLHAQPIVARSGESPIYAEVLSRIQDGDDLINAGVFWPLVERFKLEAAMDRSVLLALTQHLAQSDPQSRRCFGVNLSPMSLFDLEFTEWLEREILASPFASRLVIEIPERALKRTGGLPEIVFKLAAGGVRIALDRFGLMPAALGSLQNLPLTYVKIDRRFISGIDSHKQNQFYVRNLVQIAQSCDIEVIAEGVETSAEWRVLGELGVGVGQGYLFAEPTKI
ncbi:EAL domain-containing protein [Saccharophagus degradans]|uniref:bifunctional diguanylate cyclase/phosphodiesterase n=1 Tax=Saccharophagus degradans TaxID=86304 RepID=UPI001C085696|nr:EAL domain-containing protein [Saccharophagus degradans]